MKLYDYELSGNCYKARLLLNFLNIPYERVSVDFYPGKEHKSTRFLEEVNPLGQIPVLEDNGFLLRDAQAILVYLASRYDPTGTWWPVNDPSELGRVAQWLAFADSITSTASAARTAASITPVCPTMSGLAMLQTMTSKAWRRMASTNFAVNSGQLISGCRS